MDITFAPISENKKIVHSPIRTITAISPHGLTLISSFPNSSQKYAAILLFRLSVSVESNPNLMESTSMIQQPDAQTRNWLELPKDVMSTILLKVGVIEILTNAQKVCSYWWKICKDPLMWRFIHLDDLYNVGNHNLEMLCKTAVDRSCGQLIDIDIDIGDFGTNELLQYITQRSNQLRRLRIANCVFISDERLSEAVSNLTLLEHLEIWSSSFFVETLKTVGQRCPSLKSLKLNRQFRQSVACDNEAIAIAETMPKLLHLQIIGNNLANGGLQAILDGCPDLESLDLRLCFALNLAGQLKKSTERIKNLQLPHDRLDPDMIFDETDSSDYEDYVDYDHYDVEDDYSFGFPEWRY